MENSVFGQVNNEIRTNKKKKRITIEIKPEFENQISKFLEIIKLGTLKVKCYQPKAEH